MRQLVFSFMLMLFSTALISQVPQKFNYQGISRDLSGNPLPNQTISLRISILEDSTNGFVLYQEMHTTTTSDLGLFSLEIGAGTLVQGNFSFIDWGKNKHFLQLEIDETGGNNYQLMGTSELLSVPYALTAARVQSYQSNGDFSVVSNETVDFPFESSLPQSTFSVWISDTNRYDPFEPLLDGMNIYHREPKTFGDVCLKLTAKSLETFDVNNSLHSSSQIILNAVSSGRDQADFTIQNEYTGPYEVRETFRVKHNGNVGIGSQNPVSKLQVADGDIYIEDVNRGVVMKSPNGQCWRMTVSNSGQPVFSSINCPN